MTGSSGGCGCNHEDRDQGEHAHETRHDACSATATAGCCGAHDAGEMLKTNEAPTTTS